MTDQEPSTEARSDELGTGATTSTVSSVVNSSTAGEQTFSAERGRHELKVAAEEHNRQMERLRTEQELAETREDNAQRRLREKIGFFVVVGIAVLGLGIGFAVAVESQNDDTRRWAQGLVTLLFGGIVGGLAGYFTGKVGR